MPEKINDYRKGKNGQTGHIGGFCLYHNTQKTEVGIFVSEMNASQDLTEVLIHFKIPCILSEIEE